MSAPPAYSIETLSGRMFDFAAPRAEDVDIKDIADALGNTCRFAGHVKRFYSVAEHACLVYWLVKDTGFPPDVCFAALHHDSHEAYLIDAPTPLKQYIKDRAPGVWERLEYKINVAIGDALGVKPSLFDHDAVKCADTMALGYEAAKLKPNGRAQRHGAWLQYDPAEIPSWAVQCLTPRRAAVTFLSCHAEAKEALG